LNDLPKLPQFECPVGKFRVADIKVGKRHRQDMGDIAALARSIRDVGLIQSIPITPDGRLVAGERRLVAVKELGWQEVDVHVVANMDDALAVLRAEHDENTCRKDFTPSEAASIGMAIEALEKPKARERQKAGSKKGGKTAGKGRPKQGSGKLPEPCSPPAANNQTRDKVAEAVGMSGRTYEKAKRVVEAAEAEPETFGPVKEEMDRTGNVDGAYKKVKRPVSRPAPEAKEEGDKNGHFNISAETDSLYQLVNRRRQSWPENQRVRFTEALQAVRERIDREDAADADMRGDDAAAPPSSTPVVEEVEPDVVVADDPGPAPATEGGDEEKPARAFEVGEVVTATALTKAYDAYAERVLPKECLEEQERTKKRERRKYKILAPLPGPAEYRRLKNEQYTYKAGRLLDDAFSEIQELGNELEWSVDNMPESLQGSYVAEQKMEAGQELTNLAEDKPDLPDGAADVAVLHVPSLGQSSRANRASEIAVSLRSAAEALRGRGFGDVARALEEVADNLEMVEFPGMYG
jgi:ParB-like chromosome segregation protein Spo0J